MIVAIGGGALAVLLLGAVLVYRADHRVNHLALGGAPRPVTVVAAVASPFRDSRSYVGAVDAWLEASVGPQYISAFVETVLVRPGAIVKRGEVLATLDCSHPTAASEALAMQARAVSEHQRATADEAAREETLLDGGFIASNDVEQTHAKSTAERAQLLETEAQQASASQDVKDCALRAPFDGEIATRRVDPGAFVTPGTTIVSVVDRSIARVVVDAPEKDFAIVSPGTPVRITLLATGAQRDAKIARRAPKADPQTRTVHFEIDLPDPERAIPADTTALVHVDVGQPVAATTIPLYAATEQEGKARVFVVENGVAHQRRLAILGESAGDLYFDPKLLAPGTTVVTEGRALLSDGDPVQPKLDTPPPGAQGSGAETRGGGYGRPL